MKIKKKNICQNTNKIEKMQKKTKLQNINKIELDSNEKNVFQKTN